MLTLYQFEICPFCWKIKAFLHYHNREHKVIEVNPMTKREIDFSTEYKKVPILVDGEQQINGSIPILNHLEGAKGDEDPIRQKWMEWVDTELAPAIAGVLYASIPRALRTMRHIVQKSNLSWWQKPLVQYGGPIAMRKRMKKMRERYRDPEKALADVISEWVEQALAGKTFCGGDTPNLADFSAYGVLRATDDGQTVAPLRSNEKFAIWYDQCKAVMEQNDYSSDKSQSPLEKS